MLSEQQTKFMQDPRILELQARLDGPRIQPLLPKINSALEATKVLPEGKRTYETLMLVVGNATTQHGLQAGTDIVRHCLGDNPELLDAFATVMEYRAVTARPIEYVRGEYSGITLAAIDGPVRQHPVDELSGKMVGERMKAQKAAIKVMTQDGGFTKFRAEDRLRKTEGTIRSIAENDYGLTSLVPKRH